MEKHLHCKEFVDTISSYVDGDLSEELCAELDKHLSACENCRIVVNTLRKTIDIVHQQAEQEKAPIAVKDRLFYRLNLEQFKK
ncbi:MAG: zf-HC2 domain-containing protein [Anaerolineaceae bacterium]|jgi:mycothiol system anti-sigma-R factor|nr:zf-HC2 domain-containing protein [Anaerolineaceae bacterium]